MYFHLEEPAWFVFKKVCNRHKTETIAEFFSNRYGMSYADSLIFVTDIRNTIKKMNQPRKRDKLEEELLYNLEKCMFTPFSTFHYAMGSKIVKFAYGTSWLENYIHPLIKHLETFENIGDENVFELFYFQDKIVFRFNNMVRGSWSKDQSQFVKGNIFVELINVLHDKIDDDWLMTVHASAISNGRKTILFSAAAGSGKTTIAALLQARGYQLISDDFVPIDQDSFRAYPFPIAMSVKEGSLDLLTSHYPVLEDKPLNYINPEKSVRYLPVENIRMKMIFPVKEFIFIKYDSTVDFIMEKLDPVKAIQQLLDEAWILPSPENVLVFFNKIVQASFFQLNYSNNEKALEAITQLFDND
jgi:hypothetical protein